MADQQEPKKAASKETEGEPEPSPYEKGEWVPADEGTPPNSITLVYYSVPGQEPDVRLGTSDGEFYNDSVTGRATPVAEVGGFKSTASEAPSDPGIETKASKDAKEAEKEAKAAEKDAAKADAK